MTGKIAIAEKLFCSIKEHTDSYYSLQIILFFTNHPCTRFNDSAIIQAINQDGGKCYIQKALRELVDRRIIITYTDGSVILYALSENMRSMMLEMAEFDLPQQHRLLRQTCLN